MSVYARPFTAPVTPHDSLNSAQQNSNNAPSMPDISSLPINGNSGQPGSSTAREVQNSGTVRNDHLSQQQQQLGDRLYPKVRESIFN